MSSGGCHIQGVPSDRAACSRYCLHLRSLAGCTLLVLMLVLARHASERFGVRVWRHGRVKFFWMGGNVLPPAAQHPRHCRFEIVVEARDRARERTDPIHQSHFILGIVRCLCVVYS
jgi:hypothetical protein